MPDVSERAASRFTRRLEAARDTLLDRRRVRADGGQQQIGVGTVVRDRESEPGSDAVVVQLPDAPASDRWIPQLDETVADANPDYPPDADVAVIVFRDRLEDELGEWRELTADGLQTAVENADLPTYDYPVGRLEVVA